MCKRLTISVVTADRSCLGTCLKRLSLLPRINEVTVLVCDNSKTSIKDVNQNLCKLFGFNYFYDRDFIKCRNKAVELINTEYFVILDDDDYFTIDSITLMLHYIEANPEVQFISFGVRKQGRLDPDFDNSCHRIQTKIGKLRMLNEFDKYNKHRFNHIYLWNSGIVLNTGLIRSYCEWKYKGCDDILPITTAYLKSDYILRVNSVLVEYPVQTSVTGDKPIESIINLEDNMIKSYSELLDNFTSMIDRLIIKKSIKNSIRQLQVIDNYNPSGLIKLL